MLKNSNHPAWIGALKFAAEYAYGKPSQDLTITAKMTLEQLVAKSNDTSRVEAAEPAEVLSIGPSAERALSSTGRHWRALPSGSAE